MGKTLINKLLVAENDGSEYFNYYKIEMNNETETVTEYMRGNSTIDPNNFRIVFKNAIADIQKTYQTKKQDCEVLHFIISGSVRFPEEIKNFVRTELGNNNILQTAILTIINKENKKCVTKEQYKTCTRIFTNSVPRLVPDFVRNEPKLNFVTRTKSIGDDLDDFCDKIADNKLENITGCYSFQLSLLTANHKKYLELKKKFGSPSVLKIHDGVQKPLVFPEIFREIENVQEIRRYFTSFQSRSPDVSEAEMARSESDSKYSAALCSRHTYIL